MSPRKKPDPRQLSLFGADPTANEPEEATVDVAPVAVADDVKELGRSLPEGLRLGTSSWSFPGWIGLVYAPGSKGKQLARQGLAAYAQHPLLRTVGIDRTFYAPIGEAEFADYRRSVPDGFRFLVKAWSDVTTPRLRGPGGRPGAANPRWLDVETTIDQVLTPAVLGLGPTLGPLVFQFPPQGKKVTAEPKAFAERLAGFLGALPKGPCYAIELRDRELFTPDYAAALASVGARHCHSVHPGMPTLPEQAQLVPPAGELVVRWMLHPGSRYDEAVERYEPFDRLVDPDPVSRAHVADLVAAALALRLPVTVVVNNKAEGSSPQSVELLARALRERLA